MNPSETVGVVAGALQLLVAGYALRLNRRFGPKRVGWSLFWAFLLLAFLHLVQSVAEYHSPQEFGTEVNVIYGLISLLLLTGMVHLETVLIERERVEREETRMRAELEAEVQKKTEYLMRAVEELQAEIEERKRMEVEVQTTSVELQTVSRQAETARVAGKVLQSVGEMLKSVNVSTDLVSNHVKQSKIANVVHVGALIRDHAANLAQFMAQDPRGRKLPAYIAELAGHLAAEQAGLLTELDSIKTNLEKIAAMQQNYASVADAASSSVPTRSNGPGHSALALPMNAAAA
ncbi:MAG: hypothetical protein KGR98_04310 [Verrucomicrobia bacterium]|nr:hypothetical protein [Verrucomicrobiota bacterium]MDE3099899.1 hypothetical protein [Verrucomicrobiota bacterium]